MRTDSQPTTAVLNNLLLLLPTTEVMNEPDAKGPFDAHAG
ncbi:MAG: hypothetical protein QOE61_4809 [Micromonosporaceae bacterium]|nr:hypothetical protein [Micromonosporaceae bacterium]